MVSIAEWLRDWRKIAAGLREEHYEEVVAKVGDAKYEVLRVSLFDEGIDGTKPFVQTSSSAFEGKTALYSHLTRDIGLTRVITIKGRNWFILEAGADVHEWIMAAENMAPAKLRSALRSGILWQGIAKKALREKKRRRLAEAKVEELEHQIRQAKTDADRLQLELQDANEELTRIRAN